MYKKWYNKSLISILMVILLLLASLIDPIGTYSQNIGKSTQKNSFNLNINSALDSTIDMIFTPLKQLAYQNIGNLTGNSYEGAGLPENEANMVSLDEVVPEATSPGTSEIKEIDEQENSLLPGVPINITIMSSYNDITLVFEAVYDATGYEIEADGIVIDIGDSTSYTHTQLEPDTEHIYRVRANNAAGNGEWSDTIFASTDEISIGIPQNVSANIVGESVNITWESVIYATDYDIEIDGLIASTVSGTSYTYEGILEDTEHTCRLRARNEQVIGEWSPMISLSATTDFLIAPTNIQAFSTSDSISLVWEEVYGATGYDIEADGLIIDVGNVCNYNHTNLQADTEHKYRVSARNDLGTSEMSSPVSIRTKLEGNEC